MYQKTYYDLVYNEIYDFLMKEDGLEFYDSERRYTHEVLNSENTLHFKRLTQSEFSVFRNLVIYGIMKVTDSSFGESYLNGKPVLYRFNSSEETYDYIDSYSFDGYFEVTINGYKIELIVYKNGYDNKLTRKATFVLEPSDDEVETKYKILKTFGDRLKGIYVKHIIDERISRLNHQETYEILRINNFHQEHIRNY